MLVEIQPGKRLQRPSEGHRLLVRDLKALCEGRPGRQPNRSYRCGLVGPLRLVADFSPRQPQTPRSLTSGDLRDEKPCALVASLRRCGGNRDAGCGRSSFVGGDYAVEHRTGWLLWQTDDVRDEPDRWEMTVYLASDCPVPHCTVDITPRHLKRFDPKPGDPFRWTNTPLPTAKAAASGIVGADEWSLVTLRQVTVSKAKNRIAVFRE